MRMLLDPSLLYSLIFGVSLGSYANEGCDYKSYLFIFACSRIVLLCRLTFSDGVFLCGSKELPQYLRAKVTTLTLDPFKRNDFCETILKVNV